MRLKDKVIIVTGARKGIGESVALALAREGADLVLVSRSIQTDSPLVQEVKNLGRRVFVKQVDVGDREQVFEMVDEALDYFGRIDVLFNNAGISKPVMLWNTTQEQWEDVIRINLSGTFYCIQAVSKPMMEQRSGSIINVTSSAGLNGTIGQANYTAAKGGIYALSKSAARELARYSIRVNTISPMAETDMTQKIAHDPKFKEKYLERIPLGRFAKPEEIAPAVVFLASDESSFITGQTICIDGGMIML
ncbi:MAG TPA: glucose 1-dehydrogenase [Firmicutes bacterium]|jgi:3-oxoacyl-[acyl-carrier protein] reductase|nr:glucose 1-dehydrogenase [Bacillota bacterium]